MYWNLRIPHAFVLVVGSNWRVFQAFRLLVVHVVSFVVSLSELPYIFGCVYCMYYIIFFLMKWTRASLALSFIYIFIWRIWMIYTILCINVCVWLLLLKIVWSFVVDGNGISAFWAACVCDCMLYAVCMQ